MSSGLSHFGKSFSKYLPSIAKTAVQGMQVNSKAIKDKAKEDKKESEAKAKED